MEKFKINTEQLYNSCTELIDCVSNTRQGFTKIYESSNRVMFENSKKMVVQLTSTELALRYKKISLYYRDNIVQFCTNGISYMNDVVYIPIFHDFSFYRISTEDELFQLSTVIDIKHITLSDIQKLNRLREYFDYLHLKNNI